MEEKKTVLIFPWAKALRNGNENPKNYPYWKDLVELLRGNNYHVVQISLLHEKEIGADERRSLVYKQVCALINEGPLIITIDSFAQHLCWSLGKKCIVLWGPSDPLVFGHPCHINLQKDRKFIREGFRHFDTWESCELCPEAFVSPVEVVQALSAFQARPQELSSVVDRSS